MQVDETGETGKQKRAREAEPTSSGECGFLAPSVSTSTAFLSGQAPQKCKPERAEEMHQTAGSASSASQATALETLLWMRRQVAQRGLGMTSEEKQLAAERRVAEIEAAHPELYRREADYEAQRPAAGRRRRGKW
jgi:hypothetical protein